MYSNSQDVIISTNMQAGLKTSLIVTVLNEEKHIGILIDSVANQSIIPSELIIVDGGSNDRTISLINDKIKQYVNKLNIKIFVKKGNRSIGRNEGIKQSSSNLILITDSGCILHKDWVKNITKPFLEKSTNVVAGYYKGKYKSIFQKSLIPYVLVMKDNIDPENFLPATRSMALRKKIWNKLGGFNKKFSHNEDFVFASKIRQEGINIKFVKDAIVYWYPRQNLFQTFKMFFRFAYGDIQSKIIRSKIIYLFLRYVVGIYLIIMAFIMKSVVLNTIIGLLVISYVLWSVKKNYKYVKHYLALIYLPILQFTSDLAVISGSLLGLTYHLSKKNIITLIKNNKGLFFLLSIYSLLMISIIGWGIPNSSHPFNYFMDEWHQSQSVRNLFTVGSPNVEGSANGSIFQFFLTGVYLVPFILFGIINPLSIKSSVLNLEEQTKLFEVLRFNTLLFGIASAILFYYICKKYFNVNPMVATFFFVFNPIWIMLSNYFKYDIALIFWILLSVLFLLKFVQKPSLTVFLFANIFSALSLATKLSTLPLLLVSILIFFIYAGSIRYKWKWFFVSIFAYIVIFIIFGIPDVALGKGSLNEYLSSNLLRTPDFDTQNIMVSSYFWIYLIVDLYKSIFGHVLYLGFGLSLFIIFYLRIKEILKRKKVEEFLYHKKFEIIIFLSFFLFAVSLYPLKIGATNNRLLVLLPFMIIVLSIGIQHILNIAKKRKIYLPTLILLSALIIIQLFETYSWVQVKITNDPRHESSAWITSNIKTGSFLGIENVPIYQGLPDVVLKDFYLKQYDYKYISTYNYIVIPSFPEKFPKFIILTNEDLEKKYMKTSQTNEINKKMKINNYKRIATFTPDFKYLNIFTSDFNYYMSGLIQVPLTISIYEK